jgi:hypothetical protein
MRTYVKAYFSTEGPPSFEIAEKVKKETGLSFIRGERDIVFKWKTDAEFIETMRKIHNAFSGTKAFLSFYTEEEVEGPVHALVQWPPASGNKKADVEMLPHADESSK